MPNMPVQILVADFHDISEIHALQLEAYATEDLLYDISIPPVLETLDEAMADFPQWHVLKAVADGRIVGSVRGRMENGACQIARLMVLPACRGRGLGAALLDVVERAFPDVMYELFTGDRSVFNIRMYQRHGYEIVRESSDEGLVYFRKNGQTGPA